LNTRVTTSRQESQWVLRAQCDDREALECLIRSIQAPLRRYVANLVGAAHADDVLQDTLIIVCRKLKTLHAPELFRAWVFRIASREGFRYLRKERRHTGFERDEIEIDEVAAPEVEPPAELLSSVLSDEGVSAASRAVLALHFQEGLTLMEVAAVLELPLGTVKSRLAYGLTAIRKQLGKK
jgi:RNA polymerase sigma-70 factor, ECF subfamily